MDIIRRAATVSGRVQGVSFRYHTDQQANRLGLTGWVRNAADGTVRLEVQGRSDAVDELLTWARSGPSHAVVDDVEIHELDPKDGDSGFRVTG